MTGLLLAVVALVAFGSLLAMAESSMTRMTIQRARVLVAERRRNAALLERIESDPPRYLNSVYLAVMLAQNGSAVLVAVIADRTFSNLGITLASIGFTLVYFVLVEAMSKTFAVLHSDRVALTLAPFVVLLRRILSIPSLVLIGLSNVLLPGKGLREGPFVSAEDIRQMAEAGKEAGSIEEEERELIYSVLELSDVTARDVMVPRPDMAIVKSADGIDTVIDVMVSTGHMRIPIYDEEPDDIVGIVYAKDVLQRQRDPSVAPHLRQIARPPLFIPETVPIFDVLRSMQAQRVQMAIVMDEHGDVAGLLTLEDIVEEVVGDITDEEGIEQQLVTDVGPGRWRARGSTRIREFHELADAELPEDEEWTTIAGLVTTALAKIPEPNDAVTVDGFRFRVEAMTGRRIDSVLVERLASA